MFNSVVLVIHTEWVMMIQALPKSGEWDDGLSISETTITAADANNEKIAA